MVEWVERHPDESFLRGRKYFKVAGLFTYAAPAIEVNKPDVTHVRVSLVSTGGQGQFQSGNSAFASSKRRCSPGETFEIQVGLTAQAGPKGDSWVRRMSNGEVICYADRGRGAGPDGLVINSIGDIRRPGIDNVQSGGDEGDIARLGFGGRIATMVSAPTSRAAAPGGGGWGAAGFPANAPITGGLGLVAIEFYAGDPGDGY